MLEEKASSGLITVDKNVNGSIINCSYYGLGLVIFLFYSKDKQLKELLKMLGKVLLADNNFTDLPFW
ncbi:hypothetical protein RJD24_04165 [Bacillaceae bacterium IKA-2]|nr:hypothetical protein RJD24_04165 [Bacillaceae bacterium IKA-2]